MMTKWKKDDIALFTKNPNYYGTMPHIDGFGLKLYTNEDAMIQALKNNEIDAIESVPPNGLKPLQASGFTVAPHLGLVEDDFIINSSPNFKGFPELENPQVRQAFEYAIDKQNIVNTSWLGQAKVATSFLQPAVGHYFDTSLKPLGFSIDKANQILDGLGYTKGSDGIRVANGHPMAYTVITPSDIPGINTTFSIIQQDFAKIGVKLTQKSLTEGTAWDEVQAPIDPKTNIGQYANYQLVLWQWTGLTDPDFMLSVLTCESYSVWNDTGYCNSAYDNMYAQQGVATTDKARQEIIWKMQEQIAKDRPYIMIDYENWTSAWSSKWTGFIPDYMGIFGQLSTASLTNAHQVG
jgi:peptide/nickel transport system substrate-binding protein